MAIDYSMLFRGVVPQIDAARAISDGMQLGQNIQKQRTNNAVARLFGNAANYNADGTLNLESLQANAMQSPMAGQIMPSIIEQRQAASKAEADRQKTMLDALKTQAEIGKIGAETSNLGITGKKGQFELDQTRVTNAQRALGTLAGNQNLTKAQTLGALQNAWRTGAIDGATFQSFANTLIPMDDAQAADFVRQQALGTVSPDKALSAIQPQVGSINLNDVQQFYTTDPMTGKITLSNTMSRGISPDTQATIDAAANGNFQIIQTPQGPQLINPRQSNVAVPIVGQDGREITAKKAPVPVKVLETITERTQSIIDSSNLIRNANEFVQALESGELDLDPLKVAEYRARNAAGQSTPDSQMYERMAAGRQQLANQILQAAKGTQTEGDAQRAVQQFLAAPMTDAKVVANAYRQMMQIAMQSIQLNSNAVRNLQQTYGIEPMRETEADQFNPTSLTNPNEPTQRKGNQPQQQNSADVYTQNEVLQVARELGIPYADAVNRIKSMGGVVR